MGASSQCLILVSASEHGVCAESFIQSCSLIHSSLGIQLASPEGKYPKYVGMTDVTAKWMDDFKTKSLSVPMNVSIVDPSRYACLLVPHSHGALYDLAFCSHVAVIVNYFLQHNKPVCAVGDGVAALLAPLENKAAWLLSRYCLTATSLAEQCVTSDFSSCPIVLEDRLREAGVQFSAAPPDGVHVSVDRHVVSGQNRQSTVTAVQNLVLLYNQCKKSVS